MSFGYDDEDNKSLFENVELAKLVEVDEGEEELVGFAGKICQQDLEDAILACAAAQAGAHYLITGNAVDFTGSPVPVLGPSEFLALMAARTTWNLHLTRQETVKLGLCI